MALVFIGIGSNIGNREKNIKAAIRLIKNKCRIIKMSSLYETEPVGYKEQGWFLNCALKLQTGLKPEGLLNFFQSIEKKLGRAKAVKNGPRTIDLDILFYGSEIMKTRRLTVPHPRLHKRLFVLEPLNEICPEFVHPKLKKRIGYLRNRLRGKEAEAIVKIKQVTQNNKKSGFVIEWSKVLEIGGEKQFWVLAKNNK